MANEFYDHGTYPVPGAPGSSSAQRNEWNLVEAGFDKLPTMAGNGNDVVVVNSGGTALTSTDSPTILLTNATGLPLTTGVTGTLPATNGGTGHASFAVGDILYASTTTALSKLADVATGNVLLSGGVSTAPSWGQVGLTTHVTGTLPVANGGTGVTSSTGTGNVVLSTSPTLVTPALGTPSAAVLTSATGLPLTTGVTGTLPVANGGTNATTAAGARASILPSFSGNAGKGIVVNVGETDVEYIPLTGSGTVTSVGGTGTVNGLTLTGTVTTTGSLTLGGTLAVSNSDWSGTDLSVANGGTGLSTLTANNVILGNGSSSPTFVAPSTSGNVLTSNGTTWESAVLPTATITRSARTSNTILGVADKSTLIDVTSGTFAQTFEDSGTLGSGWFTWYKNSGTGIVTLTPDGSETIDGAATLAVNPGDYFGIQSDGSNLNTFSSTPSVAWNYISSVTASGAATADIEDAMTAYDEYMIIGTGVFPSTDAQALYCRLKIGGSYITTSTYYNTFVNTASSAFANTNSTVIAMTAGVTNNAARSSRVEIKIPLPSDTTYAKSIMFDVVAPDVSGVSRYAGGGINTGTAVLTGVRILAASGNINGQFDLYGRNNA